MRPDGLNETDRLTTMTLEIKICGLRSAETVAVTVEAGADMIGFVFFPRSPRNVSVAEDDVDGPDDET